MENVDQCIQDPKIIVDHITKLKVKKSDAKEFHHTEILDKLLSQLTPIDFAGLVYPAVKKYRKQLETLDPDGDQAKDLRKKIDRVKLKVNHYLILSIEEILSIAKKNKWGLCKHDDSIYMYTGQYWKEVDRSDFQNFLGQAAEKLGVDKFSARFHLFNEQLYKQFLTSAHLKTIIPDKKKVLINLLNGTAEITQSGIKLRPFDPADFLTYQLPFAYDPKATYHLFQKYLDRVLPDISSQRVVSEFLGYVFIKHEGGGLKMEKALMPWGSGANGKSVLFEITMALFGSENVSTYSLQSLTEEKGFYRAKINNKLVNYATEISSKLNTEMFKKMISGEPVEACAKYGQPFTMSQYAKFIFNVNEFPKDVEYTNAYFRRFLIIPFTVTIPEREQNKNLHTEIIDAELSGVFNWVLDGLTRLLSQKRFSECDAADKALDKYRTESDSVLMFLDENRYIESLDLDKYILLQTLFKEYNEYCKESGFRACSSKTFKYRIEKANCYTKRITPGWVVYIEKDKSEIIEEAVIDIQNHFS